MVQRDHLVQRVGWRRPQHVQHLRDGAGDIKETDPALQEGFNSDLIRGIQIAGAPPPASNASRARRSDGKRSRSGAQNPAWPPRPGRAAEMGWRCAPARPEYGRSECACRASRAAPARTVVVADHAVDHRLRMHQHLDRRGRAAGTSRAASMTSRPLFIMVAESMLILAPIDQTGWRSAASGVALRHLLQAGGAERAARGGQDDLLDGAAVAVGHRLEDGVVLGIAPAAGWRRPRAPRAASPRRRRPALPCWPAPRTCRGGSRPGWARDRRRR